MSDPHRDRRKTVSEAAIQCASQYGAATAGKIYGHCPSTLNKKLRERGLGRGRPRGGQSGYEPGHWPGAAQVLDRCGYVSPEQVRCDVRKEIGADA